MLGCRTPRLGILSFIFSHFNTEWNTGIISINEMPALYRAMKHRSLGMNTVHQVLKNRGSTRNRFPVSAIIVIFCLQNTKHQIIHSVGCVLECPWDFLGIPLDSLGSCLGFHWIFWGTSLLLTSRSIPMPTKLMPPASYPQRWHNFSLLNTRFSAIPQ